MNVQESNMSLLKQKNHILLTVLSIVFCVMLLPVIGSMLLLPQVMTLMPVMLLALLAFVGPVSAVACTAILITMTFTLFGGWASLCMALLLLPTAAATVVTFERRESFFTAAAAGCVAMFASLGAMLGLLSVLAGSDVVTALTDIVRDMLAQFGWMGDMLLSMLVQIGGISLPEGYDAAVGIASIDPQLRKELLSSFVLLMDTALRLEIPMQMATGSIAAGLFGQAIVRKGMIRRGAKVEYPALHTWRVPKGWGRILGGTLAALYVLSRLLPSTASTMFYVFSGIFDQVFALQGIAAICYLLHDKGKKGFFKGLVFVLGYTLLRSPAVIIGIFDQLADFTHRREKLEKDENPFDPRSNHLI
ncbi:MAG: DUF2232 domain-containing protein [Clostridia bacterium]|nr:DUF2232 domain-containing protein [Clostridia bacterium]